MNLLDLPNDVLLEIFLNLDLPSLKNMTLVSWKAYQFFETTYYWNIRMKEEKILSLSSNAVTCWLHKASKVNNGRESYMIARRIASIEIPIRFRERVLLGFSDKQTPPRLALCGDHIWISSGKQFLRMDSVPGRSERLFAYKTSGLVADMALSGKHVAACTTGSLVEVWEENTRRSVAALQLKDEKSSPSLTFESNVVVAAVAKSFSVLRFDGQSLERNHAVELPSCPSSLALQPSGGAKLAIGFDSGTPLTLWNLERSPPEELRTLKQEDRCSALHWERESLLLSAHGGVCCMWDLRSNTCAASWKEPYRNKIASLRGDGANGVLLGADSHALFHLLDKRRLSDRAVRSYFCTGGTSLSAVFRCAVQPSAVYCALDAGVSVVDFAARDLKRVFPF